MNQTKGLCSYIQDNIISRWDENAFTDYRGSTLKCHDVAQKIEELHIMFEKSGIQPGDKIALCGRNSSNWGVAFFSILTYGAVAVPILHEFKSEQIHNILNHSESVLLFLGDNMLSSVDMKQITALKGIVRMSDFSLADSRNEELTHACEHITELYAKKHPEGIRPEHIHYYEGKDEELALINYTSGTTGYSKGVMIPYRAIVGNLAFCMRVIGPCLKKGSNMINMLPLAHMYGMLVELIFAFCNGCHVHFLTRVPSPSTLAQAFIDVRPAIIIAVPLIIEKIVRMKVLPKIQTPMMRFMLHVPILSSVVKKKIREQMIEAFGGKIYEVIVGGAPFNQEIESFLRDINFPISVGYGATECAPLISFSDYMDNMQGSCGQPVDGMEVKILRAHPDDENGEIVTRGQNVMLGYYKDAEATANALDSDGWYHTGDLGMMLPDGHIFIRGRLKSMLLSSNGQNVYPEEIEDKLGGLPLVGDCLVVQRGEKFVALVYPAEDALQSMSISDIQDVMNQNMKKLNHVLPAYSKIAAIEVRQEPFEKTPKKSIRRFLYS